LKPGDGSLQKKTSFYYSLLLLPGQKRKAMESLYRFCWAADEISDGKDPLPLKKKKLTQFQRKLKDCFSGQAQDPLFADLRGIIRSYQMSLEPLSRILKGVERDLKPLKFKTFRELHQYALQVAGGPGLASMEIFGFKDKAHRSYAENLGVFLQLVNIVRDFKEDKAMGRQYLPIEDFKRFHLNPDSVEEGHSHWKPFVEFQLDRAWTYLEKARRSLSLQERGALMTAESIAAVYVKLHQKLRHNPHRILRERTALTPADKLLSVVGSAGRCLLWKTVDR
jgi:phytoene synthase